MKTYKLSDVKKVCDVIYGRKIAKTTWCRWKNILAIEKSVRMISLQKLEQLITLSKMKRAKPYGNPTLLDVLVSKVEALKELHNIKDNRAMFLLPDKCLGGDIPKILRVITGRELSYRTLYRRGKQIGVSFSINTNYEKETVLKLIDPNL